MNNLHIIWIGGQVPNKVQENYSLWMMNSNLNVILWDDSKIRQLGQGEWLNSAFHPAQRADILRIEILNRFGGWYVDADCLPGMRRLPEVADKLLLFQQDLDIIPNSVLYAPKGHPFLSFFLVEMNRNLRCQSTDIVRSTGPYALRIALYKYLALNGLVTFRRLFEISQEGEYIHFPRERNIVALNFFLRRTSIVHIAQNSWSIPTGENSLFRVAKSFLYVLRLFSGFDSKFERIRVIVLYVIRLRNLPKRLKIILNSHKFDLNSLLISYQSGNHLTWVKDVDLLTEIQVNQFIDVIRITDSKVSLRALAMGWKLFDRKEQLYRRLRICEVLAD